MRNWISQLQRMWKVSYRRPRAVRQRPGRPAYIGIHVTSLEDRATPSVVDLVGGALTYTAAAGETNVVSLQDQGNTAKITDSGAKITLTDAAAKTGFKLAADGHMVFGPNAGLTSTKLDLGDMNDTANIQSISHGTMVLSGDGNDTINVSSNVSLVGNLAGINADLSIDAGAGVNSLNVSDFTANSGNSAVSITGTQILGMAGPSDGAAISYAATGGSFGSIRVLGSNSPVVAESFTVNNPAGVFRLDANAGPDIANIQNISAAASINTGAGNDTIIVSSDAPANLGTLDGIQGTLSLDAGTGANALHVSDFGQTTLANDNIGVTPNQITGIAGMSNGSVINYRASGGTFSDASIDGSDTLPDSFKISGKTAFNLNGNGGDDSFSFMTEGAAAGKISGGAGVDSLSYPGYTSPVSVVLAASDDTGFSSKSATGVSEFSGIDSVAGGTSPDDSITGEDVASTWDISDTPTYEDGSHKLAFSGFETLNGGSAVDTFNVTKTTAGVPMTLNGNGGDDVFTATTWDNIQGDVAMNGGDGANTLTVDDSANVNPVFYNVSATDLQRENGGTLSYSGMATVTMTAGSGAGNAINVESTPAGTAVTIVGGAGQNDFQVSQIGNNLDSLLGDVTLVSGSGSDTVTVNDQLNPLAADYTISDKSITRTGAAGVTLVGAFDQLAVLGGSDGNTLDVTPSAVSNITLDGGLSGKSALTYHTNGSTTFANDGFAITDPTAGMKPVQYSGIASIQTPV
jgi:hypothetical protein